MSNKKEDKPPAGKTMSSTKGKREEKAAASSSESPRTAADSSENDQRDEEEVESDDEEYDDDGDDSERSGSDNNEDSYNDSEGIKWHDLIAKDPLNLKEDHVKMSVLVSEKLLREILHELKKLREDVVELRKSSATNTKSTFKFKDQEIENSYAIFLKELFSSYHWLDPKSTILMNEVKEYVGTDKEKQKCMVSFAKVKFTHLRSELRSRLLSAPKKDVLAMSLDKLCEHLYNPVVPQEERTVNKERKRLTMALRAFITSETKEKFDWKKFKEFYDSIMEDTNPDKWKLLQEKEENKIKKYQEEKAKNQEK